MGPELGIQGIFRIRPALISANSNPAAIRPIFCHRTSPKADGANHGANLWCPEFTASQSYGMLMRNPSPAHANESRVASARMRKFMDYILQLLWRYDAPSLLAESVHALGPRHLKGKEIRNLEGEGSGWKSCKALVQGDKSDQDNTRPSQHRAESGFIKEIAGPHGGKAASSTSEKKVIFVRLIIIHPALFELPMERGIQIYGGQFSQFSNNKIQITVPYAWSVTPKIKLSLKPWSMLTIQVVCVIQPMYFVLITYWGNLAALSESWVFHRIFSLATIYGTFSLAVTTGYGPHIRG
ncbi:hypothetical protein BDP27DRAFT_1359940 [Rhodocollybia butyracea]|uniref:Uncharacterized protein n=1 Tax=Rhodocollybia butyracea TaxID=206335 RepID=A0A9P5Q3L8_9AGAR|nr:hypothetical protein BDP27DRAFT_1359940 [Rhodocollybia butyracea]